MEACAGEHGIGELFSRFLGKGRAQEGENLLNL
jgi:hypothetical protein